MSRFQEKNLYKKKPILDGACPLAHQPVQSESTSGNAQSEQNSSVDIIDVDDISSNKSTVSDPPLDTSYESMLNKSVSDKLLIDTLLITDSTLSGVQFLKDSNIKAANYPSAKTENVANAIEYFSSEYENISTVVLHTGTNDIKYGRKTEQLKQSFKSLIHKTQQLNKNLVISGPVPMINCSCEHFSRIAALNEWLLKWCWDRNIKYVNNFKTEWDKLKLYNHLGTKLNFNGKRQLLENIENIFTKSDSD